MIFKGFLMKQITQFFLEGDSPTLMCLFSESNRTKFWSHSFNLQSSGILQTRMDQRGTPWKQILTIFKYKNEYRKQLEMKNRWKNGVICLVSFFAFWVMVLKLSKIVQLLQVCADLSNKLSLLKQFTYIHLKDLIMLFQKIVCFIDV